MRMTFSIFLMLSAFVSGAFGQTNSNYYVSTTGNDSNPGTRTGPWRTDHCAADTARAGSIVNVLGGVC